MFYPKKRLSWLVVIMTGFFYSGCHFHLQTNNELYKKFGSIEFYSADPYSLLAREVKNTLIDNQIKLVDASNDNSVPVFRVISYRLDKNTVSIYRDGKAAEYQLTLTVKADVMFKKDTLYPIKVKIFRSFFDNPSTVLAKNTEQTLITQEMYKQAANQLIRHLSTIISKQNIHD